MKKELIWNAVLLALGVFVSFNFKEGYSMIPGTSAGLNILLFNPFGGLVIGSLFCLFRYLILRILRIENADLRLAILLSLYIGSILFVMKMYSIHAYKIWE